jgi:predicted dehydrogenase
MTLTVVCEGGTLRCESHRQRWRWIVEPEPDGKWHDEPNEPFHRDLLYIAQACSFLDAIEGTARPLCTLAEAVQTLRVNLATLRAADEETWQIVDA